MTQDIPTLKYTKIDPASASIEEIEAEIARLDNLANFYNGQQMAFKEFMNSIYGATASIYFICYNVKISEAITLQAQSVNKFAATLFRNYVNKLWHKDTAMHKHFGYEGPVQPVTEDPVTYGDTDSVYIEFKHLIYSINYKGDYTEFVLDLYKRRIKDYIEKAYQKYSDNAGTPNIQALELEKISRSMLLLSKKKYALDVTWEEPNIFHKSLTKISDTGIETRQASTPVFARKHLFDILYMVLDKKHDLDMRVLVKKLKSLKEGFKMEDIDNISWSKSITDYDKFVIDDKKELKYDEELYAIKGGKSRKRTVPIHVRAAATYNHKLHTSKYRNKYHTIKSGTKVKYYYCIGDSKSDNVFGYEPGVYPYELGVPVDWNTQFSKTFLDAVNRFVMAMGRSQIPASLVADKKLF